MQIETTELNGTAFEKIAGIIAAEPEEYDQKYGFGLTADRECGTACCVMGHAARIAGGARGLTPTEIEDNQQTIAGEMLGLGFAASVMLFAATWPVEWFFESGAAELDDLKFRGDRDRRWDRDGRLARAEPLAKEAVIVLRWIAKLGAMPAAA